MSDVLHVIDHDSEPDVLREVAVRDEDQIIRGRLGAVAQRWRTWLELRRRSRERGRGGVVVAWGERALAAVKGAGAAVCVYRPSSWIDREPVWDLSRLVIVSHSRIQQRRMVAGAMIPQPVPQASRPAGPESRGILGDDFVWLLSADGGLGSGLKQAVWAGALMHLLERDRRRHRVLLVGDSPAHRRAAWFADQLGLPGLVAWDAWGDYAGWAIQADAALLLPDGPSSPWSAAVARVAGLPIVANGSPETSEALAGYQGLVRADGPKPRLVVRAMVEAAERARIPGEPGFTPQKAGQAWMNLLESL